MAELVDAPALGAGIERCESSSLSVPTKQPTNKGKSLTQDPRAVPVVTEESILGFFGEYRSLSNFHLCPVNIQGITFPSSEHAYMAEKTGVQGEKRKFLELTASEAKKYGQTITLRPDWEYYRVLAMTKVLLAKFTQNQDLRELLLKTGYKYLEETNWWKDRFWGVCNGEGLNMLGKTLMVVRGSFS